MNLDIFLFATILTVMFVYIGQCLSLPLPRIVWVSFLLVTVMGGSLLGICWDGYSETDVPETSLQQTEQPPSHRPVQVKKDGYVTSESCRACHPHYFETWHSSHHRTMTQVPTKNSVIADFDDHIIRHSGREFRFFEKEARYFMEMKVPKPNSTAPTPSRTFELVLSTGAHHQQAFWCVTSKGRSLGKLPFIWITSENRWIPYGAIFVKPPTPLSMRAGMWNQNCIKCHVVSGRPRSRPESVFDSHVAEFGISCEACHGPAEDHVAFHAGQMESEIENLKANRDPTLVIPAQLSHEKSSQVCGQCHSVFEFYNEQDKEEFNERGYAYRPGRDLEDSRRVVRYPKDSKDPAELEKRHRQFWSDGMVRVSGREYNGLLETPCFQRGKMSCLSCHSMHPDSNDMRTKDEWADDQLKPTMRGNQACIQCHQEFESEDRLVMHTHHAPDSAGSNCYNCHMPHTTIGLMKVMRSHTVDSPNIATTLSTGRPNACNLCHLDQTLGWTARHLENWYGIDSPQLNQEQKEVASSIRWILKGDAGQRIIAGWHYGWKPAQDVSGTDWMAPYLAEMLTDSYDVARFTGYHALKKVPEFKNFEYDFVGSNESRQQCRQGALKYWNGLADRPTRSKSILIDPSGRLEEKRFRELRQQRLDPPVYLAE